MGCLLKNGYITQAQREYVINCKMKFALIMRDLEWGVVELSAATRIPASTIYGWLDVGREEFMGVAAIAKVCEVMKITPAELLADPMWIDIDQNRFLFVRPWMEEDIETVRLITEFYFKLVRLLKKKWENGK